MKLLILLTINWGLIWSLCIRLFFIIVGVVPQYLSHRCWSWINSRLNNEACSRIMIMLKHLNTPLVVTLSIISLYWSCTSIIVYLLSEWTSSGEFINFSILWQIFWVMSFCICFLRIWNSSVNPIYSHHLLLNYILFLFLLSGLLTLSCIFTCLLLFNNI